MRDADRLAEIQARAAKATEGRWGFDPEGVLGPDTVAAEVRGYERLIGNFYFGEGDHADADREFVLNARTDMDWLIREVLALQSEVAATTGQLERLAEKFIQLRDENRDYKKCFAPDEGEPTCRSTGKTAEQVIA